VLQKALVKAVEIHNHVKPEDDPDLDDRRDVTRADMRLVGRMNHYMTGKYAYAIVELARADQALALSEYLHDVLRKQALLTMDDGTQKYRLDARIAMLPQVQKAYRDVLEKRATKAMLQALVEGLKAKQELYSREVTRRQVEKERS
jgi:L-fucose mutarotase/ribose pyranase (RbsD/FucU family)